MRSAAFAALVVPFLVLHAAAQFETRSSTPTPESPSSIAIGDFNRDGKLDIAVSAFPEPPEGVGVYLGNGDGTFGAPVFYPAGKGVGSMAVGDFRGNGLLDLAVASGDGIDILLGNGDGTFQSGAQYPLPNYVSYVATGDFNNDHKLDLVFINYRAIGVMLGNGDGTFQQPIRFVPPQSPISLGVGDFNRDGKLDLVVGRYTGDNEIRIYFGNGDGTFTRGPGYEAEDGLGSIAVSDFRGNGILDLAVASQLSGAVYVLLGNGDGTFQPAVPYSVSGGAEWVAAADLNGDGIPDMAVANFNNLFDGPLTSVSVFTGVGDGTFQGPINYTSGKEQRYLAVADFNNDNQLDLIVPDYDNDDVLVLLNTGVASFSPTTPLAFPPQLLNTESKELAVKLTNSGTVPLTISSVAARGEFKVSDNCGTSVKAGAKCTITVRSVPTVLGALSGTVSIRDSASSKPQVIELSGAGTVVELSPTNLSFGAQSVGTKSAPQQVTLTNTGSTALSISNVYVENQNWTSFSQTNNCGSSVPAGGKCMLTVSFDPVKKGALAADLDVYDSGGGTFQRVTLTGTGD
jgi:hypothetical protein